MSIILQVVHATRKSKFIVDSEEDTDNSDGEELIADEGHLIGSYDTVCAICDNGGEILPYVPLIYCL